MSYCQSREHRPRYAVKKVYLKSGHMKPMCEECYLEKKRSLEYAYSKPVEQRSSVIFDRVIRKGIVKTIFKPARVNPFLAVLFLFVLSPLMAQEKLIVYSEGKMEGNYVASGWMGRHEDLRYNQRHKDNPKAGEYCTQIKYLVGQDWAGIYWQYPPNNWGQYKVSRDLSQFKKLSFWIRGETGNEFLAEIGLGGITGGEKSFDSDQRSIYDVKLTKEWEYYEIDLEGMDLSSVIGGFYFSVSGDYNPEGTTFYLDEVIYQ